MKVSHYLLGRKRLIVLLCCMSLALLACGVGLAVIPVSREKGEASVSWNVRVTYAITDSSGEKEFVGLDSQDVYTGDGNLYLLVKGYVNTSTYAFYASDKLISSKSGLENIESNSWTVMNPASSTTVEEIDGENYILYAYDPASTGFDRVYFYFRRHGDTLEYYEDNAGNPKYWDISFCSQGSENDIASIEAKYSVKVGSEPVAYVGQNNWTANPITFTIGTSRMAENGGTFSTASEILTYSEDYFIYYNSAVADLIDGGKSAEEAETLAHEADSVKKAKWLTVNGNTFTLKDTLDKITLWVKLTDANGDYPKYAYYGDGEDGKDGNAIPICIDAQSPSFSVTALTHDADGNEITYANNKWACSKVSFTLSANVECKSGITFQYSDTKGVNYVDLGGGVLEISASTSSIKFRALNGAGKEWADPFNYSVQIDRVCPEVALSVFTVDPDLNVDEYNKELKNPRSVSHALSAEGVTSTLVYDPANDKVLVHVYNRNDVGEQIASASKVTCYMKIDSGGWAPLTDYKQTADGEKYFYFQTDNAITETKVTRYYQFRLDSEAGLKSDVVEICVTLVKSTYSFDLCEDYIEAKVNQTGWISDKATIRVIVETDSKSKDGKYTDPTTEYSFYYWTEELTGNDTQSVKIKKQATKSVGTPVEFYDDKNGVVRWIYQFDLRASANSFFNICAVNAAGVISNVKATPDQIKIDVLEPTTAYNAYIYPTDGKYTVSELQNVTKLRELADEGKIVLLDADNPGWVNGAVYLVLSIKVGVSGVYLKNMVYEEESSSDGKVTAGIWKESDERTINFNDDNTYYYYFITLNNDTGKTIAEKEFRYRAYTGSGIYKEITFTARFDFSTTIGLRTVKVDSETGICSHSAIPVESNTHVPYEEGDYIAVCEGYTVSFASTIDRTEVDDHYSLYYYTFESADVEYTTDYETILEYADPTKRSYTYAPDRTITGNVASDSKGILYYAVYVVSDAQDSLGQHVGDKKGETKNVCIVKIEYDTYDVTVTYSLDVTSTALQTGDDVAMESGTWLSGMVEVKVQFPTDINGEKVKSISDDYYRFEYLLIASEGNTGIKPTKTVCETRMAEATDEEWETATGTADDGALTYSFFIRLENRAFFGVIGISVVNKANYRSDITYSSMKVIRIDNTKPDISEIFYDVTGDKEGIENLDEATSRNVVSVYSSKRIYLDPQKVQADNSRSPITYYYKVYTEFPTDSSVIQLDSADDMTVLSGKQDVFNFLAAFSEKEYSTVYLVLFAKNTVAEPDSDIGYAGASTWSTTGSGSVEVTVDTVYAFVFDPGTLSGNLDFDLSIAEKDESTGHYAYNWQETVRVTISAVSTGVSEMDEYIKYSFSTDDGETWFDYMEGGIVNYYQSDKQKEITFTYASLAEYRDSDGNYPFANGVQNNFKFRAMNKAGSFCTYDTFYVAMDETVPEFTIDMLDMNAVPYINDASMSLAETNGLHWTSGPVTVQINVTKMPASGVYYKYYLSYRTEAGNTETTQTKVLLNPVFTTDTLDGFNENRDAILTIYVINNSKCAEVKQSTQSVRISVDKVVPVFTLSGQSENSDGLGGKKTGMVSGDWTNLDTVTVSKAVVATNVSTVVYTYTWQSASMSEPTELTWSSTETSIKQSESGVMIVTARNESGLSYTQTYEINIDTIKPVIKWSGGINVIDGENYYIDLQVSVDEANIYICEYITVMTDTRGFAFDPTGYVLSTSSVDNTIRYDVSGKSYRGYVRVHAEDRAGNVAEFVVYILPFRLTVNTITLDDADQKEVDEYEKMLEKAVAAGYMEESRITYFENLISRLRDRTETLKTEIESYQNYLEDISNRSSFELRSDYADMYSYRETFENYEVYGQKWIQTAITGDVTSKYYGYYQNFLEKFDELFALKEQVENVEKDVEALPAINMVEAEDYEDILRVWDEFYELSEEQWACFSSNLENKLTELKKACEVLMLYDKETGIQIYGSFAEGARVRVTQYGSETTTYQNAEKMLMSTYENTAIVSIYRVGTYGASNQTVAGDAEIELPIAEDFQNYIDYLVYELADDGSMSLITGTEVQPMGETILVPVGSGSFGGTYVLCVKAAVKETEAQEDVFGSILGLELDTTMIKTLLYAGAALFGIMFFVCIVLGIRHRRFLNSYNRAYRNSIYKRSSSGVPKGNKFR